MLARQSLGVNGIGVNQRCCSGVRYTIFVRSEDVSYHGDIPPTKYHSA